MLSQTLAMNLDDAGFSSTAFHECRAAVQYLANGGRAIAVVLDWQMPGMDGGRVLEALRALACAIPVIVVSATRVSKDRHWQAVRPISSRSRRVSRSS
jgi:DNA-binding response OmpR family regulator